MKDREKQIEEMAKILCDRCMEINKGKACPYYDKRSCFENRKKEATYYYEQGYRKIDKDSVVLSREGYEELKQAKILFELREEIIKFLEDVNIRYTEALELKVNEKERKETAKKFYNTIIYWILA